MRVALMTNNYKPIIGGVPISIERLAAGLVRMGHEVTIFAPSYAKSEETEQQDVELTNSAESGIPICYGFEAFYRGHCTAESI